MLDCVVIGAGLAGLQTARSLQQAGAAVVVLEARDRVGGRTHSHRVHGRTVDLGAQWLGAGQKRVERLAKELGVATFPQVHEGRKVVELGGSRKTYEGTIPALPILSLLELEATLRRAERAAGPVDVLQPWTSPAAEGADQQTLAAWLARSMRSAKARETVELALRVVFGADAEEVSNLYVLAYAKAAGGLMKLVEVEGGAQQTRFVDGAQSLSEGLAQGLDLRLETPVRSVLQTDRGVEVEGLRARFVVCCLPPPLAARIDWQPVLPAARDQLGQRMPMGTTIKCFAFYERAFWRDAGSSGEGVSDAGPAAFCIDASQPDGSHPALLSFLVGKHARTWGQAPPTARKHAVLEQLARLHGPEALRPIDWLERDWAAEPYSRGCPTAFMTPGTMTAYGAALRQPVGRIHWAGTETATEWTGYMEGALQSGERAAAEVLARL